MDTPYLGALRHVALALTLTLAFGLFHAGAMPALAQDVAALDDQDADGPDVDLPDIQIPGLETPRITLPGKKGDLVFHGNYCGPGSRGVDRPPVDALDEACMHHDACSPAVGSGRLPTCGCNARLAREAGRVARRPGISDDERVAALFVAEGAKVLACK